MVIAALACSDDAMDPGDGDNGPPPGLPSALAVEVAGSGYNGAIHLTAPAGDSRLFVVEQAGRVRIIDNGQQLVAPFLDITGTVQSGGERGLFSVAFHPDYSTNGYFYVNYTDQGGDTQIERYSVSGDPNVADPNSALPILNVAQPFGNHNGGQIAFGPDGMLYIGMGDGGSGGDPQGHGQNLNTLLGAMLRIDINGGTPYAIPSDNPYTGDPNARDEIWAHGLRNPWRFSFDHVAEDLYVADVGQDEWEEVTVVPADEAAVNYGWNVMEGAHCFNTQNCDSVGLEMPAVEYDHGDGCSITGGYTYRGQAIPGLRGHYLYSDYCSGFLRSFRYDAGSVADEIEWDIGDVGQVLSFGEDAQGELYVLSANGNVYRLIESN